MEIYLASRYCTITCNESFTRTNRNGEISCVTFGSFPKRTRIKIAKERIITKYMKDLVAANVELPDYIPKDLFLNDVLSGEIEVTQSRFRCDVDLALYSANEHDYRGTVFMKTKSRDLYDRWIVSKLTAMYRD